MKQVHFSLQGKGGVGKSLVASLVTQYLSSLNLPVTALDIDPANPTLSGYKALNVKRLEILDNSNIDESKFDEMIDMIIEDDANFVIDNGASSFVPFSSYIKENNIVDMIHANNKQVYVHMVIKAGQDLVPTVQGFNAMAQNLPEQVKIIVWLNNYSGRVLTSDGKAFEESKIYKKNQHRVHGIVTLRHEAGSSQSKDMKKMLESWLTFDEVNNSPDFSRMPRERLKNIKNEIFSQLDKVIQ